ncbi:transposase [Paenibacillus sp. CMAA1364]
MNRTEFVPIHRVGRPAPGYSYTQAGERVSDEEINEWIMEFIAGEGSAYGYRKLTILLRRRYHLVINKKKVYRLCKKMNVLRPQRKRIVKHGSCQDSCRDSIELM